MKKDKIVKRICNSSRLPWEEAAAPKGAAAHSLGTTALESKSCLESVAAPTPVPRNLALYEGKI